MLKNIIFTCEELNTKIKFALVRDNTLSSPTASAVFMYNDDNYWLNPENDKYVVFNQKKEDTIVYTNRKEMEELFKEGNFNYIEGYDRVCLV